ncbi:hypothetical protein [Campylobacter devanensis]|uniref:hypothetical protein n=1 Tax=Campylobacter devanensis TaxID=3161138 RepID=UPI00191C773E|nr:hypothetical protein [Campylobacter sp. P0222]
MQSTRVLVLSGSLAKEHKNSRGTPRSGALGGSRECNSLPAKTDFVRLRNQK